VPLVCGGGGDGDGDHDDDDGGGWWWVMHTISVTSQLTSNIYYDDDHRNAEGIQYDAILHC
jgi:hypothetical protein